MNEKLVLAIFLLVTLASSQSQGCVVPVPGSLRCSVCDLSLQLDNEGYCKLYTPIEGCDIYNSSGGCATCVSGFLLSSGICLTMLPHCLETTSVDTCDSCASGYSLIRYSNCFSTNVDNCPLGSLPRSPDGKSYCQKFAVINCGEPSSDRSYCSVCNTGYKVINGICFPVTSSSICQNNNCGCQGYYFNNTCYKIQIANCLQSSDGIYCDLCANNFYASMGFCYQYTKSDDINCNLYTLDNGRCAACNLNYVLNSDFICVRDFHLCTTPCTSCPTNFNLYEGNCLPKDPLCRVYNFTKQACVLCEEGYSLDPRTLICTKKVTCLSANQGGVCQSCFSGYQLDFQANRCLALPPNCLEMNITSGFCLRCTNVTSLSSSGCIFPTSNCTSYDFYGLCQTCTEGYVQVRRSCLPVATNCKIFGADRSKCQLCNEGYHLDKDLCYLIVQGCINYFEKSFCNQCDVNYQLINGNCLFKDPNCLAQDVSGQCLGCSSGYLPSKGRCVYFDPYCLAYDDATLVCVKSFSGFSVSSFNLQQQLAYLNFVNQAKAASKSALSSDFVGGEGQGSFSRNGVINWLPYDSIVSSSVSRYSLNGNIISCKSGFTQVKSQCLKAADNCYAYDQYGNCQECIPGFDMLLNGVCVARSQSTCQVQAGGICVVAASGYTLINGSAIASGRNVAKSSAEGLVTAAASGYFVWSAKNLAWALDFNCLTQFNPGNCLGCASGFAIWNGRCVLLKSNCIAYSQLGLCMGCNQGYLLWAGSCRESNCLSFDSNGLCSVCSNGFTMSLGVCLPGEISFCQVYSGVSCRYCLMGYYLTSSNLCSKMISNCLTANPQTGRCTSCVSNYTYYNQQCILEIKNCYIYSQSLASCSSCVQLYYPYGDGTKCGYLGMYCSALSDAINCSQCKTGFTLITQNSTKMCVRPIQNCYWYDSKANCLKCKSGYVLQFNACKSMRCDQFFPPQSLCQSCLSPYILKNNSCLDPNCLKNIQQICLECLPRYYLKDGLCILITDPKCQTVNINGTCITCLPGYALDSNGLCVSTDQLYNGCEKRQSPCTKCSVGYDLRDGLCWARKCATYKSNRDCQICIYYYDLEPTKRFCILYTCASPSCYLIDAPPDGFYVDIRGNLNISYCVSFNGPNCITCSNYRYPNPAVRYGLCYPYNCLIVSQLNCTGNCLANFVNVPAFPGSCLAANCSAYDKNGKCLTCLEAFILSDGLCKIIQIANCIKIDYAKRVCITCRNEYSLWNAVCRPSNCSRFGSDNLTCLSCLEGYFLVKDVCYPGKCSNVNGQLCLQCLQGYYLQNGLCYASSCLSYDKVNMVCLKCIDLFELVPNIGICQPSNCLTYDSSLYCSQCSTGYILKNGVCKQGDSNCVSWNQNGDCTNCKDSYVAIGSQCIQRVPGCVSYTINGCVSCNPAYELKNGICAVRYCQSYSTLNFCLVCLNRFQAQANGTCIPKNCMNFNSSTWACSDCEPRFQLISPFCFTYNCSSYQNTDYICKSCQPGFTLISDTCTFINCLSPTQYICSECLPGFTLSEGLCKAPTANCAQYDYQQFICKQCVSGYELSPYGLCQSSYVDPFCQTIDSKSGLCIKCLFNFNYNVNAQQCESKYCVQFNPSNPQRGRVCSVCVPGFVLDNSQRYCISIYCLRYDLSSGNCWACIGGSFLNASICYANNCNSYSTMYPASPVCQTCKEGYQLNSNSLCVPANCASFNLDLSCADCLSGYTLSFNGLCISKSCQKGFVFMNGECTPANCQYYNKTAGGCTVCLSGYLQQGKACIPVGCISFDNQYRCLQCAVGYNLNIINGAPLCVLNVSTTCQRGYYYTNNGCVSIPIGNCSISDNAGQTCYQCLDGYLLKDNICYLIDGCLWPSFITGCTACIPGYILNGFLCISLNCYEIYSNNTCKNCVRGFTLINGLCQRNVYKCLTLDSNGNCLACVEAFRLTNGRCIAIGCQTYSPTTFVCLQCTSGYAFNSNLETCELKITIPNCFTPLNTTFCSYCNNGYIQLSGYCYLQINWCISYYNQTGLCSKCSAGYYVNLKGQCVPLPSYCQLANPDGNCVQCIQGYRVFLGQCLPNIQYCQSFNNSTGTCASCLSQYYLTASGQCSMLPAFCTEASPSGFCTSCIKGYIVVSGSCVAIITNCIIYNQNNPDNCFQCSQDYYLNAFYSCTLLPPFCLTANSLGFCLSCVTGYMPINSICVVPVSNCVSYVQMTNVTRCSQCASGYKLTSDFTCSQLPQYCLSGNGDVCTSCVNGYQVYQGICVLYVVNCLEWSRSSLQCVNCLGGYYLSFTNNNNYICSKLPSYCLKADIYGSCLDCIQGYIIYNQLCVDSLSILNCQVYNATTFTCVQCISGYSLNSYKRCMVSNCQSMNNQGQCVACFSGYQLVGFSCFIIIPYCSTYNGNGLCTMCINGYVLDQFGSSCSIGDPNCASFSVQGVCLGCINGYYIQQGKCLLMPTGCTSMGQNALCLSCLPQYVLISGICVLLVDNCAVYNSTGCRTCNSMYYLLSNSCLQYPVGCLSYDVNSRHCLDCASDYILDKSTWLCIRGSDNCLISNSQSQCTYCYDRYFLRSGRCIPYPSYCVSVDLLGNCISCAFGSVLSGNSCLPTDGRKLNCLTYDTANAICRVCVSGYSLCPQTGICVMPDPGCQNFSFSGECLVCKQAYVLYKGKCLLYPPGVVVLPNGGISCLSGYTLSNNSCLRNQNTLSMVSSLASACRFSYSSGIASQAPYIGSGYYWTPSAIQVNQYIALTFVSGKPQAIFQIGIKGHPQGWMSGYVLQFKNRGDAPWICWNGCSMIQGNNDGGSTSWLKLYQPIVATEVRIYPVSWVGNMALQVDLWLLSFS